MRVVSAATHVVTHVAFHLLHGKHIVLCGVVRNLEEHYSILGAKVSLASIVLLTLSDRLLRHLIEAHGNVVLYSVVLERNADFLRVSIELHTVATTVE